MFLLCRTLPTISLSNLNFFFFRFIPTTPFAVVAPSEFTVTCNALFRYVVMQSFRALLKLNWSKPRGTRWFWKYLHRRQVWRQCVWIIHEGSCFEMFQYFWIKSQWIESNVLVWLWLRIVCSCHTCREGKHRATPCRHCELYQNTVDARTWSLVLLLLNCVQHNCFHHFTICVRLRRLHVNRKKKCFNVLNKTWKCQRK